MALTAEPLRWLWFGIGWLAVGTGAVGVVVPGLPTTGFFVLAAWCFARSSPRFEAWVLSLPTVGPLVCDYRDGLGMPLRAKRLAIAMIVGFSSVSAWTLRSRPAIAGAVVVLAATGVAYLLWRVPTRERVVAERMTSESPGEGPAHQ
jgi:uncharacterized protein